jgi:alpha-beta hydrolase superfamily lysophospholipase
MIPVATRVARASPDLVVQRLLNSYRGWDAHHTPVRDVAWAIEEAQRRFGPDLPVALVGHSLGGRAALLASRMPPVRSAVALAPWVQPGEGRLDAAGRDVLIVHGDQDRIASLANAAVVARDLGETARVGFVTVHGGSHSMLRHHHVFDALAAEYVRATLSGQAPRGPWGEVVTQVLDGEQWVALTP